MPGSASYKGYGGYASESEYEPTASSSPVARRAQLTSYSSEPEDIYNANSENEDALTESTPTHRDGGWSQKSVHPSSDDIPLSTQLVRRTYQTPTRIHGTAHYAIGRPVIPSHHITSHHFRHFLVSRSLSRAQTHWSIPTSQHQRI